MRPVAAMRTIEVSRILKVVETTADAGRQIAEALAVLAVRRPAVFTGPGRTRELAEQIVGMLGAAAPLLVVREASARESERLEAEVTRLESDAIVAVGGGSVLDTGKFVAARLGMAVVAVPTQISHDGIVSPVAVIRDGDNRKRSLAATMPAAVIAPLHWIQDAPTPMLLAGIGDLLSNFSAIEDWRLAQDHQRDRFDDFSAFLARHAARSVLRSLLQGASVRSRDFVLELLEGLMLSGLAMAIAGTSRPCSGSEHLISHALDYLYGGVAAHGLQVAAATVPMLLLQGQDGLARDVFRVYRALNMPTSLPDLGLTRDQIVEVVRQAPRMRPGRFTILDVATPSQVERVLKAPVPSCWPATP